MAHVSYNVYFIYLFSNNINYLIILFLFHRYFFIWTVWLTFVCYSKTILIYLWFKSTFCVCSRIWNLDSTENKQTVQTIEKLEEGIHTLPGSTSVFLILTMFSFSRAILWCCRGTNLFICCKIYEKWND